MVSLEKLIVNRFIITIFNNLFTKKIQAAESLVSQYILISIN